MRENKIGVIHLLGELSNKPEGRASGF